MNILQNKNLYISTGKYSIYMRLNALYSTYSTYYSKNLMEIEYFKGISGVRIRL